VMTLRSHPRFTISCHSAGKRASHNTTMSDQANYTTQACARVPR
jgi:hypothetical protein